jgi:hypothetical protein
MTHHDWYRSIPGEDIELLTAYKLTELAYEAGRLEGRREANNEEFQETVQTEPRFEA